MTQWRFKGWLGDRDFVLYLWFSYWTVQKRYQQNTRVVLAGSKQTRLTSVCKIEGRFLVKSFASHSLHLFHLRMVPGSEIWRISQPKIWPIHLHWRHCQFNSGLADWAAWTSKSPITNAIVFPPKLSVMRCGSTIDSASASVKSMNS